MKAVPNSDMVIAGVSEVGLWATVDGGATWKKLGGSEIRSRPDRIVFDPKNPQIFYVSGCYGDAPFKTEDGGKTFQRLGKLAHADGVAVDFTDPDRKTLLLGLHEQSQSLQLSTDAGQSWKKIGDKLAGRQQSQQRSDHPRCEDLAHQHGRVEAEGVARHLPDRGRRRDVDAGLEARPRRRAADRLRRRRSTGNASTAAACSRAPTTARPGPTSAEAIRSNPIELPGKRLAGLAETQVMVSADGGAHWTKFGPPVPFRPNGLTYSDKGKAFYAWRMADNLKKPPQSIVRLRRGVRKKSEPRPISRPRLRGSRGRSCSIESVRSGSQGPR